MRIMSSCQKCTSWCSAEHKHTHTRHASHLASLPEPSPHMCTGMCVSVQSWGDEKGAGEKKCQSMHESMHGGVQGGTGEEKASEFEQAVPPKRHVNRKTSLDVTRRDVTKSSHVNG